ncbi:HipA family kinase [Patulibacter defluvii]|uniref:HipA family kinase n=1 Tax=Patulibacter defluvii TaxID=3095358 RepID=UPI002A74EC69|nr:HipA family kinase [Patulibacter sp. DM4]
MLRTVQATRYVSPLREGGSVPALVEADDLGLYVVKLSGAAQGTKALVAEIVVGELARALAAAAPDLGLLVPEVVLVDLPRDLSVAEPDPEIQEHLAASAGLNVGLDFLPRALPYVPAAGPQPSPELAAAIVWLDALGENVDRTPRNPNLLTWHDRVWLIDHGAARYRQHAGLDPAKARGRFAAIRDHVLLPRAASIVDADARLAPLVTDDLVRRVVGLVPEPWLDAEAAALHVDDLLARLRSPRDFVEEAEHARSA